MDPTRDNPIIRFTTFWWGLGTFLVFALLLAVIWAVKGGKTTNDLEDVVAKARYEIRAKVDKAQAAELSQDAIQAAIPATAKKLAASKPVEVPVPVAPPPPDVPPAKGETPTPDVIPATPLVPATPAPAAGGQDAPNP